MSKMKFKVVAKSHPGKANGEGQKFYATAVVANKVSLKTLSKEVQEKSDLKLKSTEVSKIINTFLEQIQENLAVGNSVKLGKFGTFSISIKSTGEVNKDNVSEKNIDRQKSKVNFRNGLQLKASLFGEETKFEKEKK